MSPNELKAAYSKKVSPMTPKRSPRKSPVKKTLSPMTPKRSPRKSPVKKTFSPAVAKGDIPSSRNMNPRRLRESMMSKKRASELEKPDVPLIDLSDDDDDDLIMF